MSTAKRVQLRGGTSDEHSEFIGADREVTVDTTNKTLRIHDGITPGGNRLSTSNELTSETNKINKRIDDIQHNIASSHNHDNLYSKLGHNHDDLYERKISGLAPAKFKALNGYYGICDPDGYDDVWIRTTRNGLIPYQSGGYSSIGTSSWRFTDGWFNNINVKTLTVAKNGNSSYIHFPSQTNDPGFIQHYEGNDTARIYFSVSDNKDDTDRFYFGSTSGGNFTHGAYITTAGDLSLEKGLTQKNWTISVGGVQIYFDGRRPSNAPDGSISFG